MQILSLRRTLATLLTCGALIGAPAACAAALKVHNNRLFVPVTINGVAAEALLDSAAEMTLVDPQLAAQLKLVADGGDTAQGSGGSTPVRFAKDVSIDAAGVKLDHVTVALLDMTDLSRRLVATDLKIIL